MTRKQNSGAATGGGSTSPQSGIAKEPKPRPVAGGLNPVPGTMENTPMIHKTRTGPLLGGATGPSPIGPFVPPDPHMVAHPFSGGGSGAFGGGIGTGSSQRPK